MKPLNIIFPWPVVGISHSGDCESPAAAKSLQSCPTLCDPIDGSPLGSSVPGILQARILEWVAILKVNITIKEAIHVFWFPSAYES